MLDNSSGQPGGLRNDLEQYADSMRRSKPDGFEGMNYEQRRPAYEPRKVSNENGKMSHGCEDKRNEEF